MEAISNHTCPIYSNRFRSKLVSSYTKNFPIKKDKFSVYTDPGKNQYEISQNNPSKSFSLSVSDVKARAVPYQPTSGKTPDIRDGSARQYFLKIESDNQTDNFSQLKR